MKRYIFLLSYICVIYLSIEGISYLGLTFLEKARNVFFSPADSISEEQRDILKRLLNGESHYIDYSSVMGWTIKKNGEFLVDCNKKLYKSNSSGIRSSREYDSVPPAGVLRISTYGDSYTHGDDVSNDETWQAVMEKLDPSMEVLNFGVWGYGLDQALLRYQNEGAQYKPHVVFIGFMTRDILRHVNNFRPFYSENSDIPLTKPRFSIEDDGLLLIPNPISELEDYRRLLNKPSDVLPGIGVNDYYYPKRYHSSVFDFSPTVRLIRLIIGKLRGGNSHKMDFVADGYFDTSSEAYRITVQIFDRFYQEALKNDSIPIILIFPTVGDMLTYKKDKIKVYAPLLSYFDSRNYRYIDLMDAFEEVDVNKINDDRCTALSKHYSPLANKIVGEYIYQYIIASGIMKEVSVGQ